MHQEKQQKDEGLEKLLKERDRCKKFLDLTRFGTSTFAAIGGLATLYSYMTTGFEGGTLKGLGIIFGGAAYLGLANIYGRFDKNRYQKKIDYYNIYNSKKEL